MHEAPPSVSAGCCRLAGEILIELRRPRPDRCRIGARAVAGSGPIGVDELHAFARRAVADAGDVGQGAVRPGGRHRRRFGTDKLRWDRFGPLRRIGTARCSHRRIRRSLLRVGGACRRCRQQLGGDTQHEKQSHQETGRNPWPLRCHTMPMVHGREPYSLARNFGDGLSISRSTISGGSDLLV